MDNNQLTGVIPYQLRQLSNLESMYVDANHIVGIVNLLFCDMMNNTTAINSNTFPRLHELGMDCNGTNPEVICDCCTICY